MKAARRRWNAAALAGFLLLANLAYGIEDEHAERLYRESRAYAAQVVGQRGELRALLEPTIRALEESYKEWKRRQAAPPESTTGLPQPSGTAEGVYAKAVALLRHTIISRWHQELDTTTREVAGLHQDYNSEMDQLWQEIAARVQAAEARHRIGSEALMAALQQIARESTSSVERIQARVLVRYRELTDDIIAIRQELAADTVRWARTIRSHGAVTQAQAFASMTPWLFQYRTSGRNNTRLHSFVNLDSRLILASPDLPGAGGKPGFPQVETIIASMKDAFTSDVPREAVGERQPPIAVEDLDALFGTK
jgi:hypothetical protein